MQRQKSCTEGSGSPMVMRTPAALKMLHLSVCIRPLVLQETQMQKTQKKRSMMMQQGK